jgi:hypothetical protein
LGKACLQGSWHLRHRPHDCCCSCSSRPFRSRRKPCGGSPPGGFDDPAAARKRSVLRGNCAADPCEGPRSLHRYEPPGRARHGRDCRAPRHAHAPLPPAQPDSTRRRADRSDASREFPLPRQRKTRCSAVRNVGALPAPNLATSRPNGMPSPSQLALPLRRNGDTHEIAKTDAFGRGEAIDGRRLSRARLLVGGQAVGDQLDLAAS